MRVYAGKYVLFGLVLAVLVGAPAVCLAEMVGAVTVVEGSVDILRPNESAATIARYGDPLNMGDIVRTKKDGKVELRFKDDSVVRLAPESRIRIDEYSFGSGSGRQSGILSLLRGKMRAIVAKVKGSIMPVSAGMSNFIVKTPTASAGVRGTDFFVFYTRGVTGVIFREGSGFVFNPGSPNRIVTLSAGQATFVMKMDATPLPPRRVTEGDIANHMRDTTAAGATTAQGNGQEGGAASTTPAGPGRVKTGETEAFAYANPDVTITVEAPKFETPGTQPPPPPPPPITEKRTELLTTPVTVNVMFPTK